MLECRHHLKTVCVIVKKKTLDLANLFKEAKAFSIKESTHNEPALYGVTDGKAVGTYLEHKFTAHLLEKYNFPPGNSALGIDIPHIEVDIKVTSMKQPQSSCPFKSARQKIFGLGYSLLLFVYEKSDDHTQQTGCLNILHTIFVEKEKTADFQTTTGILQILQNEGTSEDLMAFMEDRLLPCDEIERQAIAEELIIEPPELGYLTISNALQWRLQYSRVIKLADTTKGIVRVN